MATSDNIRFGRGRYRKVKKPTEDPIKEACQPTDAPPPQWMQDKSLLPKKPPPTRRAHALPDKFDS